MGRKEGEKERERKRNKGGREKRKENLPWFLNDFLYLVFPLLASVRYYYILPVNSSCVSLEFGWGSSYQMIGCLVPTKSRKVVSKISRLFFFWQFCERFSHELSR